MDLQYSLRLNSGTEVSHKTRKGRRSEDQKQVPENRGERVESGIWIADYRMQKAECRLNARCKAQDQTMKLFFLTLSLEPCALSHILTMPPGFDGAAGLCPGC